mmetsp:Transcript_41229/g.66312  ORF Transcript_41229/g.66312 Transcript_41229/m.66312 type:complete len:212 (+) Transcript_41229:568-1203(+)
MRVDDEDLIDIVLHAERRRTEQLLEIQGAVLTVFPARFLMEHAFASRQVGQQQVFVLLAHLFVDLLVALIFGVFVRRWVVFASKVFFAFAHLLHCGIVDELQLFVRYVQFVVIVHFAEVTDVEGGEGRALPLQLWLVLVGIFVVLFVVVARDIDVRSKQQIEGKLEFLGVHDGVRHHAEQNQRFLAVQYVDVFAEFLPRCDFDLFALQQVL